MKLKMALPLAIFCLALVPVTARADDQQAQQACMSDAFSVCGQFIPDRGRIATCLYSNISRVSQPCRAVLARYDHTKVSQVGLSRTR